MARCTGASGLAVELATAVIVQSFAMVHGFLGLGQEREQLAGELSTVRHGFFGSSAQIATRQTHTQRVRTQSQTIKSVWGRRSRAVGAQRRHTGPPKTTVSEEETASRSRK